MSTDFKIKQDERVYLVMNIGLNVNGTSSDSSYEETYKAVKSVFGSFPHLISTRNSGGSDWEGEETFLAKIDLLKTVQFEQIVVIMHELCKTLKQDAIAYKVGNVGYLAFNPEYSGERFEFNKDYFIEL
jgi:hypothetical protein